ncbi:DUF1963 domain-containing protein [Flaviflagellibacter deserti]|uniref:DUF1963 domain-containing protein n=1 Tax=Flaviflagellibacter deserti TaxID=2267266 RepID=A0ABV9Z1R5_9HYPH
MSFSVRGKVALKIELRRAGGYLMELVNEIAQLSREIKETAHIGRTNRLITRQNRLYEQAEASPANTELFRALLNHPDPDVQMTTAWYCGWRRFMVQDAEATVSGLVARGGEIGSRAARWLDSRERMAAGISRALEIPRVLPFPGAPACHSRDAVIGAIRTRFSGRRVEEMSALIRRAILLRPTEAANDPRSSRFGGLPIMAPGHSWPEGELEPLVFIGQINCAELYAAVGETPLPSEGLVQFFCDHDDVHGCEPTFEYAVIYCPSADGLRLTEPPVEDFEPTVQCGLAFYETMELPHPNSSAIQALRLDDTETSLYEAMYGELFAEPGKNWKYHCDNSKLFGWPDLLQGDLVDYSYVEPDFDLLLQIGEYHDGASSQSWGPGGIVYAAISDDDLGKRDFTNAQIVTQVT